MSMDAWRRNEAGQSLEQFVRCEAKLLATVPIGLREPVHQASLRRGERPDAGGSIESLEVQSSVSDTLNDLLLALTRMVGQEEAKVGETTANLARLSRRLAELAEGEEVSGAATYLERASRELEILAAEL
jgi:hypothetical protein